MIKCSDCKKENKQFQLIKETDDSKNKRKWVCMKCLKKYPKEMKYVLKPINSS